eukprot:4714851-Amphidinium_carterae.1
MGRSPPSAPQPAVEPLAANQKGVVLEVTSGLPLLTAAVRQQGLRASAVVGSALSKRASKLNLNKLGTWAIVRDC